ncbi:hypothetical protein [Octadecabacter sp. R77987]|uniref:hypothetical protein n=1 Tax=Octadecabacter sp. R77987 TaxID=3093874 RepID=UPI003671826E
MKMTANDDKMLDDLFAQARGRDVVPSDALMARISADATALAPSAPRLATPRGGFFATLVGALGGWAAIGGLAAATVAGLWLGFAPPQRLDNLASDLLGTSDVAVPFLEMNDPFGLEG